MGCRGVYLIYIYIYIYIFIYSFVFIFDFIYNTHIYIYITDGNGILAGESIGMGFVYVWINVLFQNENAHVTSNTCNGPTVFGGDCRSDV